MKVVKYLIAFFIILPILLQGQIKDAANGFKQSTSEWLKGSIYLANKKSIRNAEFVINPIIPGGILKVKVKEREVTLTPRQVLKFHFYDSARSANRNFITISLGYNDYQFMELIHEGEILNLLITESTSVTEYRLNGGTSNGKKNKLTLIFYNKRDRMAGYVNKRNISELLRDYKPELKQYLKDQEIFFNDVESMQELIQFCDDILAKE
ncbi:hypothetical protein [Ekhidna sp.]